MKKTRRVKNQSGQRKSGRVNEENEEYKNEDENELIQNKKMLTNISR